MYTNKQKLIYVWFNHTEMIRPYANTQITQKWHLIGWIWLDNNISKYTKHTHTCYTWNLICWIWRHKGEWLEVCACVLCACTQCDITHDISTRNYTDYTHVTFDSRIRHTHQQITDKFLWIGGILQYTANGEHCVLVYAYMIFVDTSIQITQQRILDGQIWHATQNRLHTNAFWLAGFDNRRRMGSVEWAQL